MGSSPSRIKISAKNGISMTEENSKTNEVNEVAAIDYSIVSKKAEEITEKMLVFVVF